MTQYQAKINGPFVDVDLSSTGTVPLRNVANVFGMSGRRDSATESRILQGRDARSVRVLVPKSAVWTRIFMMSRLWIWVTYQSQRSRYRSYRIWQGNGLRR